MDKWHRATAVFTNDAERKAFLDAPPDSGRENITGEIGPLNSGNEYIGDGTPITAAPFTMACFFQPTKE